MKIVKSTLESSGVIPGDLPIVRDKNTLLPGNLPIVSKQNTLFFLRHMRHNLEFLYKENWFAEINDSEKNQCDGYINPSKNPFV